MNDKKYLFWREFYKILSFLFKLFKIIVASYNLVAGNRETFISMFDR